jgi:uncharacterized protein DUF3486
VGQRSKVAQMPDEVRRQLDAELVKRGFSGYDALETLLAGLGISIGKSSIHRYGRNLERKLAAIKASTEAARLIAEAAPDDANLRTGAGMAILETEIFDMLVGLQDAELEDDPIRRAKILSSLAGNYAKLTRASIHQKKHQLEIQAKVSAAAEKFAQAAKKGGMSSSTIDQIKRHILGIAG